MNIRDLKMELDTNEIKEDAYLIEPVLCPDGTLCIKRQGPGEWAVFTMEKGDFTLFETFYSEHLACRYMLRMLLSEPVYYKGFKTSDVEAWNDRHKACLMRYGFTVDALSNRH